VLERKHPTEASKVAPRDTLSCRWLSKEGRDVRSDCCRGKHPVMLQTVRRVQTCRRVTRKGEGCRQSEQVGQMVRKGYRAP
jgi:hypothetical protein